MEEISVKKFDEVVDALTSILNKHLVAGQKVLWLISGGSSIPVAAAVSNLLSDKSKQHLFATLVDDKHGIPVAQTNWRQLIAAGFTLPAEQCHPIVQEHKDLRQDTAIFSEFVAKKLKEIEVSIGQFGIGEGFHTGGILANSAASTSKELVCGYEQNGNKHITITPSLIAQLDYAFINSMGESKRELVAHFLKSEACVENEPTQALKTAGQTILCSDVLNI